MSCVVQSKTYTESMNAHDVTDAAYLRQELGVFGEEHALEFAALRHRVIKQRQRHDVIYNHVTESSSSDSVMT